MKPLELTQPPQRILIIKPSAIGDVVHALPVLNLVRRTWPAAHISWLVTPTCAGLLEGHPQLNEVILFQRRQWGQSWRSASAAKGLLGFARELRGRRFDLVIDLQGLFRSGFLAGCTGAPVRIGFANARELAWMFYTHRVPIETMEQHAVDRYLTVTEALGCGKAPVEFNLAIRESDRSAVGQMLEGIGPYAVLLPGTNWPTKRWPVERFAALVAPLREKLGLESVTAGGPGDVELSKCISAARDLTGKTNLRQLVALLERAALVIANDSGPMHIASALGRPLVTPFGPTNPIRTGPYQRQESVVRTPISCSPCYSRTCWHHSCMKWLYPEPVMDLAIRQVEQHRRSP